MDKGSTRASREESSGTSLEVEPAIEQPVADAVQSRSEQQQLQQQQSEEKPAGQTVPPRYSSFSLWEKRAIVLGASVAALFSPLTGQIYLPALNVLSQDFHITAAQINLTVTTYLVFQGVTPTIIGALADSLGRRPAYVICFVVYIAANIGLALSRNYASLLVIRCLQSAGSSSTVALCQAVVSDIVTSAERGNYISITVIPVMLGPSLGPLLGGVIAQYLGWRAIFWFLAIFAAVVFILLVVFLPETCRKLVGDGSVRPHRAYLTLWQLLKSAPPPPDEPPAARPPLRFNVFASLALLVQKEIGLLLLVSSIVVSGFYAMTTAMPSALAANYGFDDLKVGLMYLPTTGGSIFAAAGMGPLINRNYRRHARARGLPVDKARQPDLRDFPIERARLEVGIPLLLLAAAALLGWGWAVQARAHVAVVCVLLFLAGIGLIGFQNTSNVMLIDVSPGRAGAAVAANNLTRCVLGAGFTAAVVPLINAIGAGWTFVIIGLLYVACVPILLLIMKNGMRWRKELIEKDEKRAEKKKLKEERKKEASGVASREPADVEDEKSATKDQ